MPAVMLKSGNGRLIICSWPGSAIETATIAVANTMCEVANIISIDGSLKPHEETKNAGEMVTLQRNTLHFYGKSRMVNVL